MMKLPGAVWFTLKLLKYAALGILPYKTWKYLYDTYRGEQKFYQEAILFKQRHDCIVTFSKGRGHSGWCEHPKENLNIDNVKTVYEPFLYFINTAKISLDVAIMSIDVECIIEALINAQKRGVKVRVISNFHMNKRSYVYYREMEKNGILVNFYLSKEKSNSIMHTKYIVKDFGAKHGSYLLTGSFNLTSIAFSNNYEDVVFTSEKQMVDDFNRNFVILWNHFTEYNREMFNKFVIENAGFTLESIDMIKIKNDS